MTIGERIAALSKERGVKQTTLAEACGIKAATVNVWLKNNAESIPSGHLIPIAHLLGCTPMELLTGSRYTTPEPGGEEQRLIDMYEALDWEGRQVILASAITETRRVETQGRKE